MKVAADLGTLVKWGRHLDDANKTFFPSCDCGRERPCGNVRSMLACKLLRVRDKDGALNPLRANRAQAEFERTCGKKNIILKARQLGMTTWVAARFFLATITRPGTLSVQVAHDRESAEEIFRIVHRFLENLPEPMREGVLATSKSNVSQIVFPHLDSEYRVESAADRNAGRGLTIQNLHCSEVSRWGADARETLASLRAAVVPEGEIVLESTPSGAYGAFYREWKEAKQTGYVQHFFPWWYEARYRARTSGLQLSEEERELMSREKLDEEQIAYRRQLNALFGRKVKQEYAEDAESCFIASGECYFDRAKIEARKAERQNPIETRENGRLEIYWTPMGHNIGGRKREYIVGVDAAGGGVDGDFAAIEVIDRETGLQCAEWYGHCTPRELAKKSAELARMYNGALLAVERNNHGYAVLAQLETVENYTRLFEDDGSLGWMTTHTSRTEMLQTFAEVVERSPNLICSRRLLDECSSFVIGASGSPAAAAGEHDDAVMAMSIAHEVRRRVLLKPEGRGAERANDTGWDGRVGLQ